MQTTARNDDETPRTALIVDYDPWERCFTADVLTGQGYEVLRASNGASGLRLAEQNPCDVILLALSLPEMSGPEVLLHLKAADATREVPVIVLGVSPDGEGFTAEGCVPKPLERLRMTSEVGRVVDFQK
jgi:twitching motility two-component system response regulator PilH